MNQYLTQNKDFFKTFIRLTVPIAAQNLIATSLNLVDMVMIGQLGETKIAAVALGNQVFFLLNMFLFGAYSGAAIFTAQFWGKKDIANIRRILGLSLIIGVSLAALFALPSLLFPKAVIGIYSNDPAVIAEGAKFLRILGASFIPMSVTFSFSFILRSTEQVQTPMRVSAIALGLNTLLGYILIFGHFGLPAMGVVGAATATLTARLVEVVIMLSIIYKRKFAPAAKLKEMFDLSMDFIKRFFHTTIPVILNESLWGLGVSMFTLVYAHMGTGVVAAANIASNVERIAFVLFFGMAHACAVMVGKQIGAGDEDTAYIYAGRFAKLGMSVGVFMGMLLILLAPVLLLLFRITPEAFANAKALLTISGCILFVRVFNMINIVGILRSGGDTRFSLILEASGIWLLAVPLAFLGLYLKLPLPWVYLMIASEEVYKASLGIYRYFSKKWINNLVRHL